MKVVTSVAPVNIAVIKYWGKSNEDLILPLHDSLSGTLSTDFMCAKTTVMADASFEENNFWLNGKVQSFDSKRLQNCFVEVKRRADQSLPHLNWKIRICSENNFPTAAGLASSAAGYACLVYALASLYEIKGDISGIARVGSGSACRSIYGGWVQWCKGTKQNGEDSIAKQVAPSSHWPEMRVLILVVNDQPKKDSSTFGMKRSVETSELLKYRAEKIVPRKIENIKEAIKLKNFEQFAQVTMEDSNQFHAICLDTFPPCFYMNDTSRVIIDIVHAYNQYKGSNKIAYTFDAGPNACLYLLESEVQEILSVINYVFPSTLQHTNYFKGIPVNSTGINEHLNKSLNLEIQKADSLKFIIYTKLGDGPKLLDNIDEHLLNNNGYPKHTVEGF